MMSDSNFFKRAKPIEFDYPANFPPQDFYVNHNNLDPDTFKQLEDLVESNSKETKIDSFIRQNPALLSLALRMNHTGHHAAWILPQQAIRPKIGDVQAGLIPDYIIGGKNSDGFQWWVVELKGADANLFNRGKNDISFSRTLNEGLCQLLTYIDYCAEIQATLRDQFNLTGFREPKGIIIIGRESELKDSETKRNLKAAWNRITRNNLQIRTYDALLKSFQDVISFQQLIKRIE